MNKEFQNIRFYLLLTYVLFSAGCLTYQNRIQRILNTSPYWYETSLYSKNGLFISTRVMNSSDFFSIESPNGSISESFFWRQYVIKNSRSDAIVLDISQLLQTATSYRLFTKELKTSFIASTVEAIQETIRSTGVALLSGFIWILAGGMYAASEKANAAVGTAFTIIAVLPIIIVTSFTTTCYQYFFAEDPLDTFKKHVLTQNSQANMMIPRYASVSFFIPHEETLEEDQFSSYESNPGIVTIMCNHHNIGNHDKG